MGYEAGIRPFNSTGNPLQMDILTNGNTKDMSNTSVGIEVKIFLHDAISRFSVMLHNFFHML